METEDVQFFEKPDAISVGDLARLISCDLINQDHGSITVNTVAPVEAAGPGALTFLNKPNYLNQVLESRAAAVICHPRHAAKVPDTVAVLTSSDPYRSFALAAAALFPSAMRPLPVFAEGISAAAHIHESASVETGCTIEPGAVIGANAQIGEGALIGPNATVGSNCRIGRNTTIGANASVLHSVIGNNAIIHAGVRLGCDGFGFAMGATHQKIPQVGRVVVQDGVEIGANTCIDRGANRDTIIGEGSKIDCQVMIGHNVVVGRHCVIVGQVGLAGSCELGDYVVIGGQAGVAGHTKVGSGAQLAGGSGVVDEVPPGAKWGGRPARPIMHWMRDVNRLRREAFAKKPIQQEKSEETGSTSQDDKDE